MGQRYEGTLIIQTSDYYSPVGSRVLTSLSNPASADDIANGKGLYDGNGVLLDGSFVDGWPLEISTEEDMNAFITLENIGRYVKYTGTSSGTSGPSVPTNPINVGDTITNLYFDTTKTPDFSKFDWNNPDKDNRDYLMKYFYLISFRDDLDSNAVEPKHICAIQSYAQSEPFYYLGVLSTPLFYTKSGWKNLEEGKYVLTTGNPVVALNHQDIWGEYISKDGQWTKGTVSKYTSGQIYQVIQQGESVVLQPIQY